MDQPASVQGNGLMMSWVGNLLKSGYSRAQLASWVNLLSR